jgi:serine/threonine-protein kinase
VANPSRLGPYVLLEPIARRPLTITYRAEHFELHRKVLIKTLKPTVSVASAFAEELEREAQILAGLHHESILELYDFVRSPDAMWLVLEDPGGFFLSELIAKTPQIDVDAAVAIAIEIARGLGHAHERGVVHRAVRPEHVLLVASGSLKILEFGVAHAARVPSAPEPFEGDATFGPPDYMAPEQILGESAGPRSDVFSLGVILYEMLAGTRPFGSPPSGAGAERPERGAEVAMRIRTVAPAPLHADVPRAVERIILRCLSKDAGDRYDDGRELCAVLEDALAARTHAPLRVLITRALAGAGLAAELTAPVASGRVVERPRAPPMAPTVRGLALVLVSIIGGATVIELGARQGEEGGAPTTEEGPVPPAGRGYVRILARPWAEVLLDGELVDTTPIARPIPVPAGRHYFTFRHPNAPEERRTVRIAAGQTILLDVTMRIDRPPPPDAGAAPDAAISP